MSLATLPRRRPLATGRRLPGFAFGAAQTAPRAALPRMDVALFAGFAASGPVGVPVAVQDVARLEAVFGAEAPLAFDGERGLLATAELVPAVRAFFAQGGRRCHVLRLAGAGETSRLPVPGAGVARATAGAGLAIEALQLQARSPGRWADGVRLAASLDAARAAWVTGDPQAAELRLPGGTALERGDLLRLRWPDGTEVFAGVAAVGLEAAAAGLRRARVRLDPARLAFDSSRPGAPTETTLPWNGASARLRRLVDGALEWRDAPPPVPGDVLQARFGAHELLFAVHAALPVHGALATHRLQGVARWRRADPGFPAGSPLVERLRLDLWCRQGRLQRVGELGLAPGHARHVESLPDDVALFSDFDDAALARWSDAIEPRLAAAGLGAPGLVLPLGVLALPSAELPVRHSGADALVRDGLVPFDLGLFADPVLAASGTRALLADAEFLRFHARSPRALGGLHAALPLEEVSLLVVPDAVQPGWVIEGSGEPLPALPGADGVAERGDDDFTDCARLPGPAPRLLGRTVAADAVALEWSVAGGVAGPYRIEEARVRDWSDARVVHEGDGLAVTLAGLLPGDAWFRVRGVGVPPTQWSDGVALRVGASAAWRMKRADEFDPATLEAVQRVMLRWVGARADTLALLTLPRHYREDEALAHARRLGAPSLVLDPARPEAQVLPLAADETAALGLAAMYHGWLHRRGDDGTTRLESPAGVAAGLIAARAAERGAWIAPANQPLAGAVALERPAAASRWAELQDARINVLRQTPRGFAVLAADTLAGDEDLRPIGARRLLMLLRRLALRLGADYVFEPNDALFRRGVQRGFEAMLLGMFERGAFAGDAPQTSFQVVGDDTLNDRASVDGGRFIVELRVAPSRPMAFVTLQLVQVGDRLSVQGA